MEFQAAVTILLCLWYFEPPVSGSPAPPETVRLNALVGDRVELGCHTDVGAETVEWTYAKVLYEKDQKDIVLNGEVANGNSKWCELNKPANGDVNLVIREITEDRGGFFSCSDDASLESPLQIFNVTVSRSMPVVTAKAGENATIQCHHQLRNSLNWKLCKCVDDRSCEILATKGIIKESLSSKCHLDQPYIGSEKLTIHNVDTDDAGVYLCVSDGYGNKQYTFLRVLPGDNRSTSKPGQQQLPDTVSIGFKDTYCGPDQFYDRFEMKCKWKTAQDELPAERRGASQNVESSMKQCTAITAIALSIVGTFALIIIAGLFSAVIFLWKQASKYRKRFPHQHLTRVNTGMTITTNLSHECNHLKVNNGGDIIAEDGEDDGEVTKADDHSQ